MLSLVRHSVPPALFILLGLLFATSPALAQGTEGLFVTVSNPITSDTVERIQKQLNTRIHAESRRLQTVVFDFNPDGKPAATAKPGVCSDLTAFIRQINGEGVLTVAFVHNKVSGHTVMPALACQELVMSKDASIGEIAAEGIEPERGEYRGYFEKDPRGFVLIRKMYDRDVQLVRGRNPNLPNQPRQYADQRDKSAMKSLVAIEPVQGVQDGQLALYTTAVARNLGLAQGTAETAAEVAERLQLAPLLTTRSPARPHSGCLSVGAQRGRGRQDARVGQSRHSRRAEEGRKRPHPRAQLRGPRPGHRPRAGR